MQFDRPLALLLYVYEKIMPAAKAGIFLFYLLERIPSQLMV